MKKRPFSVLTYSAGIFVVFAFFFLTSSPVSARTQAYCPPIDSAEYTEVINTWYASAGLPDFSLSEFSFCGTENVEVRGNVVLSSRNLSTLGLNYFLTLSGVADKNTDTFEIHSEIDTQKIKRLIELFESKKEVRDFVERFADTLDTDVHLFSFRLTSGHYFLEYYEKDDEFTRYSLPISMSDDFPALVDFKEKVETVGCSIDKSNGITYIKNKSWNRISVYSEVNGKCKRSDKYHGGRVYEIEYRIKNDWWTRIKVWFRNLTH